MKKVTATFQRNLYPEDQMPDVSVWDINVNGVRVSSVISGMSQDELEEYYHPHAVTTRMIEGAELHDADLEVLNAPSA